MTTERLKKLLDKRYDPYLISVSIQTYAECADALEAAQREIERLRNIEAAAIVCSHFEGRRCLDCDDAGFYVVQNSNGEPEQCQCISCDRVDSKFRFDILRDVLKGAKE